MRQLKFHVYWLLPLLISCDTSPKFVRFSGETQGTFYHITYLDSGHRDFKNQVDSVLHVIDQSMSTYISGSLISNFNSDSLSSRIDSHMIRVLCTAYDIFLESKRAFDPTIMPLVRYWGFGPEDQEVRTDVDSSVVDSLLQFVGMDHLYLVGSKTKKVPVSSICGEIPESIELYKDDHRTSLDLNAIAQGYAVDVISELFRDAGVDNNVVEVGGELRCSGDGPNGKGWRVGIDQPVEDAGLGHSLASVINISGQSMATSGNYRKFYEFKGNKYGHTIDPVSGYPVVTHLLSATVMATNCTEADGYATACMVLGLEGAKKMVRNNPEIDALLIYSKGDSLITWSTQGIEKRLTVSKE